MRQFIKIILVICVLFNITFAQEEKNQMTLGEYLTFESKILGEEFTYLVDLPSDYKDNDSSYPVVFCLNAQIVITYANALATVNSLGHEYIPKMILVGISNTGKARRYLPVNRAGNSDDADLLIKFLEEEFIPHIDTNYRTSNFRIIYGQSNTGFFATYAFMKKPELFNCCIAASPSYGWGLDFMKKTAEEFFTNPLHKSRMLYMNYGGKDIEHLATTPIKDFVEFLKKNGPENFKWECKYLPVDGHVPISTLSDGLYYIFPDYWVSDAMKENGLETVDLHFANLTKRYGFEMNTPQVVLFGMCYELKKAKKYDEAIDMFEQLVKRFPTTVRGHFYFAETYREIENFDLAKKHYQKALELDPNLQAAKRRLQMLEEK